MVPCNSLFILRELSKAAGSPAGCSFECFPGKKDFEGKIEDLPNILTRLECLSILGQCSGFFQILLPRKQTIRRHTLLNYQLHLEEFRKKYEVVLRAEIITSSSPRETAADMVKKQKFKLLRSRSHCHRSK